MSTASVVSSSSATSAICRSGNGVCQADVALGSLSGMDAQHGAHGEMRFDEVSAQYAEFGDFYVGRVSAAVNLYS